MKLILGFLLALALVVGGFFALNAYIYNEKQAGTTIYVNETYGFSFAYPDDWRLGSATDELFQLYSYEESVSGSLHEFAAGENKIELMVSAETDLAQSSAPGDVVHVAGQEGYLIESPAEEGWGPVKSYLIQLPETPNTILMISIYGDPNNFAALDSLVASIHWN